MRSRWIFVVIGCACAVAVIATVVVRRTAPTNLLLISVDTLRPDHLGCYGYHQAATPNIDRLARDGAVFDRAFCTVPLTLPSHTSMMTGLSPTSNGVRDNTNFKLADDFVTIAEVLRANQMTTGAVVGTFVLDSHFGLGQGFTTYDDDLSAGTQASFFAYPERPADKVTAGAVKWLDGVREPFFLFVHYYDPHAPYEPPDRFKALFPKNQYDGEIAFADEEIGKLLAHLGRKKMLKRTHVVLVSDHGESLGEHGEQTHGLLVYDVTLKVAFIIRPADNSPFADKKIVGRRVGNNVVLTDLFPTVLEMLGYEQAGDVDGRSLVPLLMERQIPPAVSYFETLNPYFAYRWSPLRGIRFNQWKYVFGIEGELYDLNDDPGETRNLAAENPEKADEMRIALLDKAREEPQVASAQAKMSGEAIQKLRSLGYLSTSPAPVPEIGDATLKDPKKMIHMVSEYLDEGDYAFDKGQHDLALRKFHAFIEADPMNPQAHLHLARVLLQMNDYDAAEKALNKVLEVDPENSGAFFHLGNIAQARGQWDEALKDYQTALEILPETPEALGNMGSVLLSKGLADSAITVLYQALKICPWTHVTLMNLGLAYLKLEMPDSALTYFRRLVAYDPTAVKAISNCAAIFVAQTEVDSAIHYFELATAAAPNDPKTWANLGGAYRQKNLPDKAAVCYEKAIQIEPDNVTALYGLAGVRLSQGRQDEAKDLLRRVLKIRPDFAPALDAARRLGLN